jgi:hypothetical protein
MIDAEISSTFSKREFEIRDPKFESKNFSPGRVNTILRTERAIAVSFFRAIKSRFRGLT